MATTAAEVNAQEVTTPAERPKALWPRRHRGALVIAVLGVVAALLLAFGVAQYLDVRAGQQADERRAEAVQTASRVVTSLTSFSEGTAKQDIDGLLGDATGEFRDQFSRQAELLRSVLSKSRVSSGGRVVEAGVSSIDDHKAVVLIAATATVKNKQAPEGQRRVYRMQVTLQREGDRWLAANLELVP